MNLSPVPPDIAQLGLRTLISVCTESSGRDLSELQSQLLTGIQRYILKTDFRLDALQTISADELASHPIAPEFKDRIIRGCIIAACIDGEMEPAKVERLERYANALQVDLGPVRTAWKLAGRNLLLARIDIVRRSLPGVKIRQVVRSQGVLAAIQQFFPLVGGSLPEVTARYRQLDGYAEGTLARAFTDYLRRNHFPFPGETDAGPEIIVVHDCLHILGEYGTTAPEEIEIAAFQAGCQFEDPIYGLLFGLAQYHLNIQVAPVAPSQELQANPEKLIAAFARGCRVRRDMWRDFDPWQFFHHRVEDIRQEFGIPQKSESSPKT